MMVQWYIVHVQSIKRNELMIQKFIEKHPDMEVIKQRTILNYEYHTDGFFMCKMKKG